MAGFFGLVAGIVGVIAYIPYVRDILKRQTRPERASWLIWSIEYCGLFLAQLAEGATDSLWLIGLQLAGVLLICTLSFRFGAGAFKRRDWTLLACACMALVAWHLTDNASVAILLLVTVEAVAVVPTVIKAYRQPGSETVATWALIGTAGLLAIPAVGADASIALYIYPLSLVVINFGVVGAALLGARAKRPAELPAQEYENA